MKKWPSKVTKIVHCAGSSRWGLSSRKLGVLTNIVLVSLSNVALTSLACPQNINRTDNLGKSLNAEPIIDRIVLPVAGPELGETERILNFANPTVVFSLQNTWLYILEPEIFLGNFTTPISP